jgi:hypothetical protein
MFARSLLTWLLMIGAEIVHGVLRTMYLVPVVGLHRASQIGVLIGSLLMLAVARLTRRWRIGASKQTLAAIGVLWVALTVAFEFLFGHFVIGYSFAYIAGDFNLMQGRLMALGLLVLWLAPWLTAPRL